MDTEEKIPLMIVSTVCICVLMGAICLSAKIFMGDYEPATIEYTTTEEDCGECVECCNP